MSIGYIPKKRKQIKRMRRARKKYKNFSCATCEKSKNITCRKRYQSSRIGGILISYYENCPDWKADKTYIPIEKVASVVPEKKKPWYRRK